ncbi:hypothetical protein D9615_003843 [Tricholomella constricta]|uniref:Fungal-type protein kinase domain-containing protein n=1 Tax=Tricholomella constricta TaxID=117010 RepID=A0A8H5HHV5_9AGAR|nr:hypothetical protein D9615_003843 [Tricholomella constricta]
MTVEQVHLLRVDLLNLNPITHASGKLWEVGSIEAFQDVFVDCLKVLHRDLSANNLRFRCTDNGGKAQGILTDWDMASEVEDSDQILLSTATHRTGTIPFMAVDLLVVNPRPPPHLFRHDLESFFYILVWAAFYYDFDKKECRSTEPSTQPPLERWNNADLEVCANAKFRIISEPVVKDQLFALVPPEGQSLLPWMNSVWELFWDANHSRMMNQRRPQADWDVKTSGGFLTFQRFMEALGRKPRL